MQSPTHRRAHCFLVCVVLFLAGSAAAEPLDVEVAVFPPHVMEDEARPGDFAGFDIDLWVEIARVIGQDYTLARVPFSQLLEDVRSGEADLALAGITINQEREEYLDFSYPYMESGLRILVNARQEADMLGVVSSLLASGSAKWLLYLMGFLIVVSHVLYFAERGRGAIERSYVPGIFEAAWCSLATLTTVGYGDIAPKGWPGRLACFLMMITGIGLFGIVVAELSAGLTLYRLSTDIEGPEDLRGRVVATVEGSTSVGVIEEYGARVRGVEVIDDAFRMLEREEVDAVVFDSPTLLYYVNNNRQGEVSLTGGLIHHESYGIAFPEDSPWREPINRALLQLMEDGTHERIHEKWFGEQP